MLRQYLLNAFIILNYGFVNFGIFQLMSYYLQFNMNYLLMGYISYAYYLYFGFFSTLFSAMLFGSMYALLTDPNAVQKGLNIYNQALVSDNKGIIAVRRYGSAMEDFYTKYKVVGKSYTVDYVDQFLDTPNGKIIKDAIITVYNQVIALKNQFETYISANMPNMSNNEFTKAMNSNILTQAPVTTPALNVETVVDPVTGETSTSYVPSGVTVPESSVPAVQPLVGLDGTQVQVPVPLGTNPLNNLLNLNSNVKMMGDQMNTMKNMMDELKKLEDTVKAQKNAKKNK
jgi:hypothetical protein